MKNFKILILMTVIIGALHACSSTKNNAGETAKYDIDNKSLDSIEIRSTTNGNMSNTYPSN